MARQRNIVALGDAVSASLSRRARQTPENASSSPKGTSPRRRDREAAGDEYLTDEQFFRQMREEIPAADSDARFTAFAGGAARGRSRRTREQSVEPVAGAAAPRYESPQTLGKPRSGASPATAVRAVGDDADARDQRKRARNSARADRMFSRQYADDARTSADEDAAPRAALYEGRTGSSQRRAARMQKASEAGPVSAKLNPAGWFSAIPVSKRLMRSFTAVLCVVLTVAFLYSPAQQYYQAMREHDRLAAEYEYVEQRNAALNSQNDALASKAGMEDAVREKYGYVVQGDETAVVTGLSDATTDLSRGADNVEANVLSSAVKAPEEWYTPYLDALFGVS